MHPAAKLRRQSIPKQRNRSCGYILLTLMLFITLLTLSALAILPEVVHQIRRDREEEMCHRGTEYMRAIKKYYKKFGRYPSRIEELENTNQQRFLRKRYKDPLTGKDFKLVRVGDPSLNMLGMGGAGLGLGPGQALGQGGKPAFVAATGGGVRTADAGDANLPQVTGLPQQSTGGPNPAGGNSETSDAQVDAKSASSSSDTGSAAGGQVFGGGPILGVMSVSRAKTIREYNKKSHYNEWLFIYDPNSDRGGLLKGPVEPDLTKGLNVGMQPGAAVIPNPGARGSGGQPPQPGPPTQEPPEEQ